MAKMKQIPKEERPIEKLLEVGCDKLSNIELLSILLYTGCKDKSVFELAQDVLIEIGGIKNLENATLEKLLKINGVGKKKAATLLAALELKKRCEQKNYYKEKITNSSLIAKPFLLLLKEKTQEHFYVIYLNGVNQIIDKKLLFKGTLNYSLVHPREVFKYAYLENANSIILLHNHPSGDTTPSLEDKKITKELEELGYLHGIQVLDHIIVGKNKYYSFKEGRTFYEE